MNSDADMLDGLPLVYSDGMGGYSWFDGEVDHYGTSSQIWDYLQGLGYDDYTVRDLRDWRSHSPADVAD